MRNLGFNLAKEIKTARLSHRVGFSQGDLATMLGINVQSISNLERGKQSLNIKHVIKLSKILEIPFEKLKRAMVQDYEDAINKEIWLKLDIISNERGNVNELRISKRRRSLMQESRVYDYPVSSGRYSPVPSEYAAKSN